MDKLRAAAKTAAMVATIEKGSSSEAPSSVMVAVRCRPFNQREISQQEEKIVVIKPGGYAALQPPNEPGAPLREFSFDYTYDDDSLQTDVYGNLGQPLLDKAFGGWNGTIFAYGQTGAGKSFSMTGAPHAGLPGIIPQMNAEMFERIQASKEENPNKMFLVTCSFLEIYNEVLYDLLDPTATRGTAKTRKDSHIDVKEDPKLGVYVAGLQEIGVDSKEKIEKLMDQGNAARAVAATQMKATSSRSHSIFIIRLSQKEVIAGQQKESRATINLVDLAGSERAAKTGATGDKLKEGANINKSLSALGNVINALAEQSKKGKKVFIPYRNSKLTRVLQESLGGNSVTVMLAAISPAAYNFEETLNTLQYADRAKAIQLKARKNEEMTEVGKLKAEIEALRAQLEAAAAGGGGGFGGGGSGMTDEEREQMEAQLAERDAILKQSFEEKERHAREAEAMRQAMLSQQEALQAEMARKAAEDRRSMLEADSGRWVDLLLIETRAGGQANAGFVDEVEALERMRQAQVSKVKESKSYISVLVAHLQREVEQYLSLEAARADGTEPTVEEQLQSKLLLEQLVLKMKSLREEVQTDESMVTDALQTLDNMVYAAEGQLERAREEDQAQPHDRAEREVADLEMLIELASKQRAQYNERVGGGAHSSLLEPLAQFGNVLARSVEQELDTVQQRLEAVEAGRETVDEQARAGMEKRVTVLKKELFVLGDVASKSELPRVLHGLSQVLNGVVLRLGKRLSMKDKAKEKSIRDKEAQLERTRQEAEQLRHELVSENTQLKAEKQQLVAENEQLRSDIDELRAGIERHVSSNKALQSKVGELGAAAVPLKP